jgi:hypothetical protein
MGAGKITVDLEAKSDKWSAGIGKAEKDVRAFVDKAEGSLKSLGGQKGAGAFADALAKNSKAMASFATDIRTGTSYFEAFGKVVDDIPIVGKFKQAGEALGEPWFKTKANKEEARKWRETLIELGEAYSKINSARAGFGKYGQEKAELDVQADFNAKYGKLANERNTLKMDAMRREEVFAKPQYQASDPEKAELARDKLRIKEMSAEGVFLSQERDAKITAIRREANHQQHEFIRQGENESEAFLAAMQEKALRRQGKGLESAIVAVETASRIRASDLADSVSDENLKGIKSEDQKAARRKAVDEKIGREERQMRETVADLRAEHDRKEREETLGNEEKLSEIRASGNIERLRIQDESLNARADKDGRATRSHLAEQAQIQEDYRKQVAELEKKYREDNRTNNVNRDDPTLKASLAAADEERRQKLGVLNAKGGSETMRNEENLLHERRKLWEQVGDAQEKYAARMGDINERHEKFHDNRLREAEVKALDRDAFEDLKRLNPTHEIAANLYGIDSTKGFTVGQSSSNIAAEQLQAIKQQTAKEAQRDVVYDRLLQWLQGQAPSGQPQELSIATV